jgi:hypothetical protein
MLSIPFYETDQNAVFLELKHVTNSLTHFRCTSQHFSEYSTAKEHPFGVYKAVLILTSN